MQITIDGPKDIHDSRRCLPGGLPTFDKIVENIVSCVDILPNISVRVNVDSQNLSRAQEVNKYFKDLGVAHKLLIYLAQVDSTNGNYDPDLCLPTDEFSKSSLFYNDNPLTCYPQPKACVCTADCGASCVIQPDGSICKCWSDIGMDELKVGEITSGGLKTVSHPKRFYEFMLYDVTEDEECINCDILPICMGGCPRRRLDNSSRRCIELKNRDILEKYLYTSVEYILLHKRDKK